jgi:Flp pilus assembly protein TadB
MANGSVNNNDNGSILSEFSRQAAQVSSTAFGLPRRLEETLEKLENGDLRMRVRSVETDRILRRLSNVNMGSNYVVLIGCFTLSATILLVNQFIWLAAIAAIAAAVAGVAYVRLMLRLDKYERML